LMMDERFWWWFVLFSCLGMLVYFIFTPLSLSFLEDSLPLFYP